MEDLSQQASSEFVALTNTIVYISCALFIKQQTQPSACYILWSYFGILVKVAADGML